MQYGYGDFGNLSETYDKARSQMPKEVLDYMFASVKSATNQLKMLDSGCGTGIITRQLAKRNAVVIGTDKDKAMLEIAQQYDTPTISYIETPTENLSRFKDGEFDLVTAFSAFHWFANEIAVSEIKRVLKSGGMFFVANRNTKGNSDGYRKTLEKFMSVAHPPNIKENYTSKKLLYDFGFKTVQEKIFPMIERLSVDDRLLYLQSTSAWNLVSAENKTHALNALRDYFTSIVIDGFVDRPIEIVTVSALK